MFLSFYPPGEVPDLGRTAAIRRRNLARICKKGLFDADRLSQLSIGLNTSVYLKPQFALKAFQ